jgi:hypothetical protein
MPNLTVRKSGRHPKHTLRPTTRSNVSSTIKHTAKRAKKAVFVHPDAPISVSSNDDSQEEVEALEVLEKVKDVSREVFTLMKCCMLGSKAVIEDTDFITLGEFSFRQFETLAIRKVDKATQDAKNQFEWKSGQAVISAKGVRICDQLSIAVEDESGWKKVEQGVTCWLRENKKLITVKLTVVYQNKGGTDSASLEEEEGDSKKVYPF